MSTDVLGPLPADQWGDEEYAAFGKLLGMPADKVPRAGSGHAYDPISAVAAGNEGFTGPDLTALGAADELLENGHLAWPSWQRLSTELGERPAIELIFLVGTYAMSAMAFRTWGLAPPPGMTPLPQPRKDY
ncbi:hypothetical protein [Mycobacterium sp. OTB74]|uniref:hypothetical protein n=1 Tax=Mycobacterium sp. OTB74 TaxID=1853452 RepID=UPI002475F1C7|nr:hypothetical protein [Mycobacterium sp. OTB74]MDH6242601.1 hypothetical protein [Mycobacterium sp. OTB74]